MYARQNNGQNQYDSKIFFEGVNNAADAELAASVVGPFFGPKMVLVTGGAYLKALFRMLIPEESIPS